MTAVSVAFMNVHPHFYHVWQVEPCHPLGCSSQALILSILALGAMPKQQQQQQQQLAKPYLSFLVPVKNEFVTNISPAFHLKWCMPFYIHTVFAELS